MSDNEPDEQQHEYYDCTECGHECDDDYTYYMAREFGHWSCPACGAEHHCD